MSLNANYANSSLGSAFHFKPCNQPRFFPKTPFQIREFRVYRRRRLKRSRRLELRSQLGPIEDLFQTLITQFPSANSLEFLAPAIGFASGVALCASRFGSGKVSDIGEWILFTSPTPFNRFLLLRCPSISFEGSELLEDVNEKLVKEDRHYVRLDSGRILVKGGGGGGGVIGGLEEKLEYQRVCLSTDDGGVISLDWPVNLDLEEEHGLDTTLLLVPGSAQGSMDIDIRSFVCDALKRGCFPVVMNPRGCAGSPLTTARLFSAADSDDICTAIQFINKARPWTTMMGVGWGYGANMLTKYLAEVGEGTPLTAAACIDNPFDLEEATRSSPHRMAIDNKLTGGLIDILRSNKVDNGIFLTLEAEELFRGRAKGFDVEKALSATSVRDFEKTISMVSYGFEAIEDFYSKSSTRNLIGDVKIPVLFIQNDDGSAPFFSIPRSSIAENPFTSLLLCSCLPSGGINGGRSAVTWCQQLTIEWLTAVELGLLKGRHPLLKDVDITINPSKGLAFMEGKTAKKTGKVTKLLDLSSSTALNRYNTESLNDILEESDTTAGLILRSGKDLQRKYENEDEALQKLENGAMERTNSADTESVKHEEISSIDSETGEVLQTAQVVMNMLDVTMPGTLTEEKKKKVLTAVGQGETVMKALEDAVPEDVREKLTTAVSGILHAQGAQLKINELLDISRIPSVSSGLKSKTEEKFSGISTVEGLSQDHHSSDQIKKAATLLDSSVNNQPGTQKSSSGMESELVQTDSSQKSVNSGQSHSISGDGNNNSGSIRKETSDLGNNDTYDDSLKGKGLVNSENIEKGLETGTKANSSNRTEKASATEEANFAEHKDQNAKTASADTKEDNNAKIEDKSVPDQNKLTAPGVVGENASPSGSSSEGQSMEKEESDNQKRDNKLVLDQSKSNSESSSPTFSVSQALDALTGMDDSTQVAVNSVFGVIENMISQLEEGSDHEKEVVDEKDDNPIDSKRPQNSAATPIDQRVQSDEISDSAVFKHPKNAMDSQPDAPNECIAKDSTQCPISLNGIDMKALQDRHTASHVGKDGNKKKDQLPGSNILLDSSEGIKKVDNIPSHMTSNTYGSSYYNENLQKYLLSETPTESLDSDATTALLLEYFPEEGQWKLLEQPGNNGTHVGDVEKEVQTNSPEVDDKVIEPLYVILDMGKQQQPVEEFETIDHKKEKIEIDENILDDLTQFVNNIILDALKVEVGRRLGAAGVNEIEPNLARDLEQMANAVSISVGQDVKHALISDVKYDSIDRILEKVDTLNGEHIIGAISSAVQETNYLRKLLPVGVIVGSTLAALRKYFNVATMHDDDDTMNFGEAKNLEEKDIVKVKAAEAQRMPSKKSVQNSRLDEMSNRKSATVMVGAVTAALGASALLVQQEDSESNGANISSSKSSKMKADNPKDTDKLEEALSEKHQNNIVTSLAEKAMSVASPVVPTKEDGEVDQERLVAMLADLGQRGGILRLVGKVALLWGGIRGAMSLTDRLISFLHIAERPLIQRVLGFVSMVLVLWSPVAVPLLPTLVQGWTTKTPSRIAELACVIGLYTAVVILIMLWGKRIRGYENPFEQYGLDLTSFSKIHNFLKGLIGGIMLVLSIQAVNALLGCANLSWPFSRSSLDVMAWLKVYGQMLMVVGQGIVTAIGVALVEELLFRSWLPEEIAADLGHHRGIIISGLVFSLLQRSPWAIPGLWLLSLSLSGVRQMTEGSLSVAIGLRAGIMASSFILQRGGFLIYKPNFPLWVTGTHPFQPFSGISGFAFSLLLALFLYPRKPMQTKNLKSQPQE
ncbi:CAAX amino terminal protease [Trema orientale]|uniref:CAAX amino terminal protease n=1 Tax=Trema orientale TaxID=63057 RepID=A0A2P5FH01_TREOI|nr:CAAX amino terminal protease [Trema orientale]